MTEIVMTRDSVCMADDVDAPHERSFRLPDGGSLEDLAHMVALSSYLPMPSDAWGWTIEAQSASVAIRKRGLHQLVESVAGDPASMTLTSGLRLFASYTKAMRPERDRS